MTEGGTFTHVPPLATPLKDNINISNINDTASLERLITTHSLSFQ